MYEIMIYSGVFATVVLLFLSIYFYYQGKDPALARLESTDSVGTPKTELRKDDPNSKIIKMLKPFQDKIAQDTDKTKNKRASLLVAAGYYSPSAQAVFYAMRLTLTIVLATSVATFMTFFKTTEPLSVIVYTTIAATIGYYLPLLFIMSRIKDRKLAFNSGFPDAMDMILICLESGLSFPASLKHVSNELSDVHPIVSEQFQIAILEFQAGRKRAVALRNLADRVNIAEVSSVVTMIIQSDQLGTSLTRALRASAEDMRRDRMFNAEEKANALPVKMSVPLVLCIFPALFAAIMVPVVVKIMRVL